MLNDVAHLEMMRAGTAMQHDLPFLEQFMFARDLPHLETPYPGVIEGHLLSVVLESQTGEPLISDVRNAENDAAILTTVLTQPLFTEISTQ